MVLESGYQTVKKRKHFSFDGPYFECFDKSQPVTHRDGFNSNGASFQKRLCRMEYLIPDCDRGIVWQQKTRFLKQDIAFGGEMVGESGLEFFSWCISRSWQRRHTYPIVSISRSKGKFPNILKPSVFPMAGLWVVKGIKCMQHSRYEMYKHLEAVEGSVKSTAERLL